MSARTVNHIQAITMESDDVQQLDRHFPLQQENETMIRTSTMSSSSGNKRSRTSNYSLVSLPSIPQTKVMDHPVEVINRVTKNSVNGDYVEAIKVLTKTLKNIKLILAGDAKVIMPTKPESIQCKSQRFDRDCTDKQKDSCCSNPQGSPFEYDFYDSSPGTSSFLTTRIPLRECESRTVRIFTNPLTVKGDFYGVALDTRVCQELSCVAIYNLALFHQLEAISLFQKSTGDLSHAIAYLQKALNLYDYSHHIFKNHEIPVRGPSLHCMALVSNLGQIHHLMGNPLKAQQCNEYLLSVLMYTIDGRKGEDRLSNLCRTCDHLMDGFFAIVQHLIISEETTAPAA